MFTFYFINSVKNVLTSQPWYNLYAKCWWQMLSTYSYKILKLNVEDKYWTHSFIAQKMQLREHMLFKCHHANLFLICRNLVVQLPLCLTIQNLLFSISKIMVKSYISLWNMSLKIQVLFSVKRALFCCQHQEFQSGWEECAILSLFLSLTTMRKQICLICAYVCVCV